MFTDGSFKSHGSIEPTFRYLYELFASKVGKRHLKTFTSSNLSSAQPSLSNNRLWAQKVKYSRLHRFTAVLFLSEHHHHLIIYRII